MTKCKACKGTGKYVVGVVCSATDIDEEELYEACQTCKGTGNED